MHLLWLFMVTVYGGLVTMDQVEALGIRSCTEEHDED